MNTNFGKVISARPGRVLQLAAKIGIDVIGGSQLVGYKSQLPRVSMKNYKTSQPNARYWVLKLLLENFGPGDKMAETSTPDAYTAAQAFDTPHGRRLLVVNKRNREISVPLPDEASDATVTFVAPSTGDKKPQSGPVSGTVLKLDPFEVAMVSYK